MNGPYEGPRKDDAYANAEVGTEFLGGVEHEVMFIPGRSPQDFEAIVPAGQYFFMGDNRDNRRDSRFQGVGCVPEGDVVGHAVRIGRDGHRPASTFSWATTATTAGTAVSRA